MFTGIVEEMGTVVSVIRGERSGVIRIGCDKVLSDLKIGDSVAVNGVCLTVSSLYAKSFAADVMPETLSRSALGKLMGGNKVNLERAMPADGRFGGHIVSGHIDGTGTIASVRRDDNAIWMRVLCPTSLLELIVEKGSICVDGISLTVARIDRDSFSVSLIPHTAAITTIGQRRVGDKVNLETDLVGKYVRRLLGLEASSSRTESNQESGLTMEFLAQNGF